MKPTTGQGGVHSLRLTAEELEFLELQGVKLPDLVHDMLRQLMELHEFRPVEELMAELEGKQARERERFKAALQMYYDNVELQRQRARHRCEVLEDLLRTMELRLGRPPWAEDYMRATLLEDVYRKDLKVHELTVDQVELEARRRGLLVTSPLAGLPYTPTPPPPPRPKPIDQAPDGTTVVDVRAAEGAEVELKERRAKLLMQLRQQVKSIKPHELPELQARMAKAGLEKQAIAAGTTTEAIWAEVLGGVQDANREVGQ